MNKKVNRLFINIKTIILYSSYIPTLSEVFLRIKKNGLPVKPSIIEIYFPQAVFYDTIKHGFVSTGENTLSKIMKIHQEPEVDPPRTKQQVNALLGLVNYYLKCIPCFSEKTVVLSDLQRKEIKAKLY